MTGGLFRDAMEGAARAARLGGVSLELEHTAQLNASLAAARFRLPNGLRVVLMPDARAPVFTYQTWFAVGSRDEDPQRTGLAHLFEHLMFKGTERHPTGELDREMESRGAQTNAATWVDWTYYTMSLAARPEYLQTVVMYEADRMQNLRLDEETFRSELEVVKNERRMSVDDSVPGTLSEQLFALAYREHPYRWPTIGAMEHLESTTREHAIAFYRKFYAPNRAVVVITGDLDPADTLITVGKGYGHLAPSVGGSGPRQYAAEPEQTQPRVQIIEREVSAPQVIIAYHIPGQLHPTHAAVEALVDALTDGDSGRLYRRLVVKDRLATEVDGFVSPFADPGLFELFITARPGVRPEAVVEVVQEELQRLAQGLEPREMNKARNNLEISTWNDLRNAESSAENLGHYEVNYGDYSLALRTMERLQHVTPQLLSHTAATLLHPNNRTVVAAVPPRS